MGWKETLPDLKALEGVDVSGRLTRFNYLLLDSKLGRKWREDVECILEQGIRFNKHLKCKI